MTHQHSLAANMMLFDPEGRIKHYTSPEDIVAEFYGLRLAMYEQRRQALLKVRALHFEFWLQRPKLC
jgi:DNA topoisomerase-2